MLTIILRSICVQVVSEQSNSLSDLSSYRFFNSRAVSLELIND
jgi:hypothetical protein